MALLDQHNRTIEAESLRYLPRRKEHLNEKSKTTTARFYCQSVSLMKQQLAKVLEGRLCVGPSNYDADVNFKHPTRTTFTGIEKLVNDCMAPFSLITVGITYTRAEGGAHAFCVLLEKSTKTAYYYNTGGNSVEDMAAYRWLRLHFTEYTDGTPNHPGDLEEMTDIQSFTKWTAPKGREKEEHPGTGDYSCQSWMFVWPLLQVGLGLTYTQSIRAVTSLSYTKRWDFVDAVREYLLTYDETTSKSVEDFLGPWTTLAYV